MGPSERLDGASKKKPLKNILIKKIKFVPK